MHPRHKDAVREQHVVGRHFSLIVPNDLFAALSDRTAGSVHRLALTGSGDQSENGHAVSPQPEDHFLIGFFLRSAVRHS